MLSLPSYEDVLAASRRIEGHAHRTPVMTSRTMDRVKAQLQGQRIGIILSGGNVDIGRFCSLTGA